MTKYILHGGFTRPDNELNRTFYEEIARDVPDGGTILLCYFASQSDDNTEKFTEDSRRLREQSRGKNFIFLLADEVGFSDQLKQADALYIRGGSTPRLLGALKKYPNLEENLNSKTIAGSSAGAYAIGRYSAFHDDESGGKIREAWSPSTSSCVSLRKHGLAAKSKSAFVSNRACSRFGTRRSKGF